MTDDPRTDQDTIAANYQRVKEGLPANVTLVAVSKTRSVEEIRRLYDQGHRDFGENYPQELRDKQPQLPSDIRWHFIGHLQRNKVKYIAPFVHLVHGVDGEKLLDELEKHARQASRTIGVLIQVHIALEETKHGLSPEDASALVSGWDGGRWPHLVCRGLMGMATLTGDRARVRAEFEQLATLFHHCRAHNPFPPGQFAVLSMGMSSDADLAVAAGSTMVRIGTALFGERNT